MALVQIATRIDSRLKQAVEEVCTQRGLKIGRFVQDALLDKLEELEDIEDLKAIRLEPTKSFSDVLSDVKPAAGRGSRLIHIPVGRANCRATRTCFVSESAPIAYSTASSPIAW